MTATVPARVIATAGVPRAVVVSARVTATAPARVVAPRVTATALARAPAAAVLTTLVTIAIVPRVAALRVTATAPARVVAPRVVATAGVSLEKRSYSSFVGRGQ